jgi:phenylalanyl-tRNA synthetase alpha chain
MNPAERIPEGEYRVLEALGNGPEGRDVGDLARDLGMDQAQVAASVVFLERRGWVAVEIEDSDVWIVTAAGEDVCAKGLPERLVLDAVHRAGGKLSLQEIPGKSGLDAKAVGGALRFLKERGWTRQEGPLLRETPEGVAALEGPTAGEAFLRWLSGRDGKRAETSELSTSPVSISKDDLAGLQKRKLLETKVRSRRYPRPTDAGRAALKTVQPLLEASQLTPDLLASGGWRTARLKRYDVDLDVPAVVGGKIHPLQRIIQETRQCYLRMGFTEISSPFVESAFWDFDVLFQPQDHPAREMQDTFYLEEPGRVDLPGDAALVERVGRTHEDGGSTGSRGWQMPWSRDRAQGAVLRTHTTAATVRALAADPRPPRRVFCVGRVFRREAITFKHLPVFTQVDGVIIDENASFATLLGTLGSFYTMMGFSSFQFRPAFFPYTEPSVEVFIYYEPKGTWVEMGGAGVFRPEVTLPLGCRSPVLAWGLGLERLAMLRYGVLHMRDLYVPDVQWLKDAPSCPSSESL